LYDDNDLLYAEHPDAYKDVASVVAALVAAGAAARVAELTPMVTVKR
jgi:RNA-splicing ligase RtcB